MSYENTAQIKSDVLFRAGEVAGVSAWDDKVLDYINRTYKSLANGSSEYLPEFIDDWWWMRRSGVLTLKPIIDSGTVIVNQGSADITFSSPISDDVTGYRFKVDDFGERYKIETHGGGVAAAELDSPYNGDTNAAASYKLMKTEYTLEDDVASLLGPMVGYRSNPRIIGLAPERMDYLYPLSELTKGVPRAFSLEDTRTVRFSHGGRDDGKSMRLEYRYRPVVSDLEDSGSSIPLIPVEYRAVLSDMALTMVWMDKNDDRANATALSARVMVAAMFKENRRRMSKMDDRLGQIYPRENLGSSDDVKTEGGIVIDT